jgi:hypothetical protein
MMADPAFLADAARTGMLIKPVTGENLQREVRGMLQTSKESLALIKGIMNGTVK